MYKQADQANRDTSSALSSSRDTGPVPSSFLRTEKQIVLSERATPENPGLYGGMWRGDGASSSGGSDRRTDSGLRNLERPTWVRTLTGHESCVLSVALSTDGQTLISGSLDKTIKIWNTQTGELRCSLTKYRGGHASTVNSVALSVDGQTLVSGSYDDTIKIWGED